MMTTPGIPADCQHAIDEAIAARAAWIAPDVQADNAKRHAADDKRTAAARVAHRALDQWIETAARSTT